MPINPYRPPNTPLYKTIQLNEENLQKLEKQDLKLIFNISNNVRSLGSLWLLGLLLSTMILFFQFRDFRAQYLVFFISVFITIVNIYICYYRPIWGRIVGLLSSCLILLVFPIGSILGAIGLYSFIRAKGKNLFGINRYKHKEISNEWKSRVVRDK